MSFDYVRKVVSGNKARFIDPDNAVNLDLVYITDRIIIMGYPATGVSGLYRNKRRDVLKFINSRHGDKWWIWNLCPLYENAYSAESMHGRVSRYPFPDHHPPPLPLLPLAVREMTAWLEGDSERVAIIHCKAGKGRSGTLLCSYLLSLPSLPSPPQLDRSRSAHEQDNRTRSLTSADSGPTGVRGQDGSIVMGQGREMLQIQVSEPSMDWNNYQPTGESNSPSADSRNICANVTRSTTSSTTTLSQPSPPPSVHIDVSTHPPYDPIDIGDEAQAGARGQEDRGDGRVDEVFRLHSSRRMKPTSTGRGVSIPSQRRWCRYIHLLFTHQAPTSYLSSPSPRIKVLSITLILHRPTGWKKPLTSLVVGHKGGEGKAWASIARYDDDYVEELKRRGGNGEGVSGSITWGGVGGEGSYDTKKMFRSCGKMVEAGLADQEIKMLPTDHKDYHVHHLTPARLGDSTSLILDRSREFRLKLHLGSLPLGWAWLIPAFHLPHVDSRFSDEGNRIHTLSFPRSQTDFAIGPGSAIETVIVKLQNVTEGSVEGTAPLLDEEEERAEGVDDAKGEHVKEDGE